jgi:hypothetical protein
VAVPASPHDPAVSPRGRLRRIRGNRTGGAVAKALGWSVAKISRYELGQSSFPLDGVEKLLDFYEVTEPRRGQLLALAAQANQRGWWEDYADALAPKYMEFLGLEAEMARQEVLISCEPPLDFAVMIDGAVILRKMGDGDLMYRQLRHLVEVTELPNVDLRILPLASGFNRINDSFIVFSFGAPQRADGTSMLHDVVRVESVTGRSTWATRPAPTTSVWSSDLASTSIQTIAWKPIYASW